MLIATKIISVNHLPNLRELYVQAWCGIDQAGITELRHVIKLDATNNSKIKSVNHLTQLLKLEARGDCGIDQLGISELRKLVRLDVVAQ